MGFRSLEKANLTDLTALVRVDFNVPMEGGEVTDDTRLRAALPTIHFLSTKGARVVLLSHFDRPKGGRVPEMSLKPLVAPLSALLEQPVAFADDCIGQAAWQVAEDLEDDAVSAEAVSFLGRELPFKSAKAILLNALDRRCLQTARACLEALGRETAGPDAEGALIQALQYDQAALRVAAAKALGRVGTAAAVLPLKEAAERFSRDRELSRATRQAIAEIQSRLPGASPGQLSLPGTEAGQLSLAQEEAGQLSLADDSAGQLALTPKQAEKG